MRGPARRSEPFGQRGNYPLPPLKRGSDGRCLCRWCEGPVPKGRRYWCGEACLLEYRIRADWGFIRSQIIERDKVCRCCGGARYSPVGGLVRAVSGWQPRAYYYIRGVSTWREHIWGQFNALTLRWEVDHVVSVVDGGTDEPSNLRLLCAPCHYDRTRVWAQDRAANLRPQAALALD